MATTQISSTPPDGRRAGATWVAATGAFLLLAAAALFIAVRWDQVPEAAKLAMVGALTGAFLVGGRAVRRTLPATGDVLFHLGAFLVPIDVAALSLRLHLGWRPLLLAEGVVGAGFLGALALSTGSVVMAFSAATSVIVASGGIAAVSPVPAPLILAAAAVAASLLGRRRSAIAWSAAAGLAPVAGAVATAAMRTGNGPGLGVLSELGLGGHAAALVAVASSILAAAVLGREAARGQDLRLVALAGACLTTGAATTWVNASPPHEARLVVAPALFLLVQAVAMMSQRDVFWRRPARAVGLAAEIIAGAVGTPIAVVLLLLAPFVDKGVDLFGGETRWSPEPAAGLAWAILAAGWFLAAWRHHGQDGASDRAIQSPSGNGGLRPLAVLRGTIGNDLTVACLAASVGAALVVGSASTVVIAAGLVVLAAGLAWSRGVLATIVAVAAAVWVPAVVGVSHPLASLPFGLAAATVLGVAALGWRRVNAGWTTASLATIASVLVFISSVLARDEIGLTPAMLTAVAAAWVLAVLVERASPLAGHLVRATMVFGVMGALTGPFTETVPVVAAAALLFALDAARHDEPLISVGSALGVPLIVGATTVAVGLSAPAIGLALAITAAVCCSVAVLYPAKWRLAFVTAAAVSLVVGLPLAAEDPARFAECLLLAGGLALGAGLATRNGAVGHAGGAIALIGLGLHLTVDGVTASEAFVAPVALQLMVVGAQLRHRVEPPSSWVCFGPAVGLLGGAAMAERLSGAPAWHSLIAGAVGVGAVAAGGWRRLAAPLFLGTGLLLSVTVNESFTQLAGIPTWAWLAAGGSTLLATGVALERSAQTPVEVGRRLVDIVQERFS